MSVLKYVERLTENCITTLWTSPLWRHHKCTHTLKLGWHVGSLGRWVPDNVPECAPLCPVMLKLMTG